METEEEKPKKMYYLHTEPQSGRRRATLAAFIDNDKMVFGISICSEKDFFRKKRGREIAAARALKAPLASIPLEGKEYTGRQFSKFAQELIKEIDQSAEIFTPMSGRKEANKLTLKDCKKC
jgi:hypothetical protein